MPTSSVLTHRGRQVALLGAVFPQATNMLDVLADESYPLSYITDLFGSINAASVLYRLELAVIADPGSPLVTKFDRETRLLNETAETSLHTAAENQCATPYRTRVVRAAGLRLAIRHTRGRGRDKQGRSGIGVNCFAEYVYAVLEGDTEAFNGVLTDYQEHLIRSVLQAAKAIAVEHPLTPTV